MKNIKKLPFILSILSYLTIFVPANAEIKVVTSIKPIHSLASYLMDGVAKPDLISRWICFSSWICFKTLTCKNATRS